MKLLSSVLAGTAMAALVGSTPAPPKIEFEEREDNFVMPKTVISSKLRLVFAVGLEGTGHHLVVEIDKHLFQTYKNLAKVSSNDRIDVGEYHVDNAMGASLQRYIVNWTS